MLLAGAACVTQQLCYLLHQQTILFSILLLTGISGFFVDVPSQGVIYICILVAGSLAVMTSSHEV